jgi:hypothetical protein
MSRRTKHRLWAARRLAAVLGVLVAAGVVAAVAVARSSAAPQNSAAPSISGTERDGQTLTASNGTWSDSPTSFAYQWQRCATDGTGCGDITGATKQSYGLTPGDVNHTVRVVVTASNADGKSSATSDATGVIGSKDGPSNTVKPTISGTPGVGQTVTTTNGSWSPAATSFRYQWQQCSPTGGSCKNVAGATGKSYGIRSDDVGNTLRVLVTAHNTGGFTTAASNPTTVVAGLPSVTTTTTVTSTVQGNAAPALRFLSLRRIGLRVVARFRVCDDTAGTIHVTLRENKARRLAAAHRFSVQLTGSCAAFSRTWRPEARFRSHGRLAIALRAADDEGALSRLAVRSVVNR